MNPKKLPLFLIAISLFHFSATQAHSFVMPLPQDKLVKCRMQFSTAADYEKAWKDLEAFRKEKARPFVFQNQPDQKLIQATYQSSRVKQEDVLSLQSIAEKSKGVFRCGPPTMPEIADKPVIYLYPKPGVKKKPVISLYPDQAQEILVQLDYQGELIADYPDYDPKIGGWKVLAYPDGRLINLADGLEYSYLFWEGRPRENPRYDLSEGFVVAGRDTKVFLQKTLREIGLTPKEYNEFIVYWLPQMQNNPYNLIHFAGKSYTDTAPLKITPQPDSMLRVFMVFQRLEKPISVKAQSIAPFERKGFSVVEWGGTEL